VAAPSDADHPNEPAGAMTEPPADNANTNALIALVDAAAQRLQIADPVAASKFRIGDPIDDPVRELQVLNAVAAEAVVKHIDPDYIKDVFRDQIDATSAIEHIRFARWKLDPLSAPVAGPDLRACRVAIDTLNQVMLNEIALQWDSLSSPHCTADLEGAKNAVIGTRKLDSIYQKALDYVTHRYCRQGAPARVDGI
jgi:chorismate mutase